MPEFRYRARDMSGELHTGTLSAPDEDAAASVLRDQGRFVVEMEEAEESSRDRGRRLFGGRVKRQDLILFTLQLSTSLDAGIQILQAMDSLEDEAPDGLAEVIGDLKEQIRAGSSLSEAIRRHPKVFGELYANLVEAGEETGNVSEVLAELADYLEWQDELVAELRQLSIYPAVVLAGVGFLAVVLFNWVLPRLLGSIGDLGVELAAPTRILIFVSDLFTGYWHVMLLGMGLLAAGVVAASRTERGRYALDWLKLQLPVVGNVYRKVALSRFSHNLAVLYGAGVGILRSLQLVEGVVGNAVLERQIRRARERVEMGAGLGEALRETRAFPGLVLQMVAVGERTGSLDQSLQKVREFYDREIPRAVDRLFTFLEPALILLLGGLIALVALGVYLPIYSIIQQIGT